ncbi:MAG: hypothetical protein QXW53_06325 [Desulfurococcaceae archaeon]
MASRPLTALLTLSLLALAIVPLVGVVDAVDEAIPVSKCMEIVESGYYKLVANLSGLSENE